MIVSELIEVLKKEKKEKDVSFRMRGIERKLYPSYYVEAEIFYLFMEGQDVPDGILTTELLKDFLEYENSDECWSHAIFRDNVSRFEDCEVMVVNGSRESFDDNSCGGVYSLASNVLEEEDNIIFVDSEYKDESNEEVSYYVTFRLDARYVAKVRAKGIEEAKKEAELMYANAYFGEAEVIDGKTIIIEDRNGDYVWEKE